MKKPFGKKPKAIRILLWIAFLLMLGGDIFVLAEAAVPGYASAEQSNAVGGWVANMVDDENSDYTTIVEPTQFDFDEPTSKTYYIGDTYTLTGTVYPSDSSYTALTYTSSNTAVATVSATGLVSFVGEGEVSIRGALEYNSKIYDTVSFTVLPVEATSIEVSLSGATEEDGVYTLTLGNTYYLSVNLSPSNVTDKSIVYTSSDENYVAISSSGSISPIAVTESEISLTATTTNGLSDGVKVKVVAPKEIVVETIEVESIAMGSSTSSPTLSVNQTVYLSSNASFKPVYTPSNTTQKGVKYSIDNTDVASLSGTTLKAKAAGEVTITMTSTYNSSLSVSKTVAIEQVNLTGVSSINLGGTNDTSIGIGKSASIKYSGATPSNASGILGKYIRYYSSDSSIFTVNSTSGLLTGVSAGTATATVKFYNTSSDITNDNPAVTKAMEVTVLPLASVSSFELSIKSSLNEESGLEELKESLLEGDNGELWSILRANKEYSSFSSNFSVKAYDGEGNQLEGNYTVVIEEMPLSSYNGSYATVNYDKDSDLLLVEADSLAYVRPVIALYKDGVSCGLSQSILLGFYPETTATATYEADDLTQPSISTISIDGKSYPSISSANASIYVGKTYTLNVGGNYYGYEFTVYGTEGIYQVAESTSTSISILARAGGSIDILAKPMLNSGYSSALARAFRVNFYDLYAEKMSISLTDLTNNDAVSLVEDENGNIGLQNIPVNRSFEIGVDLSLEDEASNLSITSSNLTITSSDETIGVIQGSTISFLKVGTVTFLIEETYSGLSKQLTITTRNVASFDEETPYTIKRISAAAGSNIEPTLDEETQSISLRNGVSYQITTNFSADSTYTECQYMSSNTNIFNISNSGVITPVAVGSAKITCTVNDGNGLKISYQVKISIIRTSAISDLNNFLYMIRKSIGHFGAFLAIALAATPFFLVGFDKKKWIWSAPAALLHGFAIAGFSEMIQLFTYARSGRWQDVWIDFAGYSCGFLFVCLIVFIVYLILYLRKRKKFKLAMADTTDLDPIEVKAAMEGRALTGKEQYELNKKKKAKEKAKAKKKKKKKKGK